jgi:hypothetical protein
MMRTSDMFVEIPGELCHMPNWAVCICVIAAAANGAPLPPAQRLSVGIWRAVQRQKHGGGERHDSGIRWPHRTLPLGTESGNQSRQW